MVVFSIYISCGVDNGRQRLCNTAGYCYAGLLPPPCTYKKSDAKIVRTVDGDDICMMWTAPFSVLQDMSTCTIDQYHEGQTCILFSHGNAEDLACIKSFTQWLADKTLCNVVSYDYVGFGHSSAGIPTEDNMKVALETVYAHMTSTLKIPCKQILLFGRSIGSCPTIAFASQSYCDCMGVMLLSPLASGIRTVLKPRTVGTKLCNLLDYVFCPNVHYIHKIKAPICIIHGTADTVVPLHNAIELQAAVNPAVESTLVQIVGAGHNNITTDFSEKLSMHFETFMTTCKVDCLTLEEYS